MTASIFSSVSKDVASFAAAGPYELETAVRYEETSTTPVSATAVMSTNSLCFASPRSRDHLIAASQSAERQGHGRSGLVEVAGLPLGEHPLERQRVGDPILREERVTEQRPGHRRKLQVQPTAITQLARTRVKSRCICIKQWQHKIVAATHDVRLRRQINLQGWWSWSVPYLFSEQLE